MSDQAQLEQAASRDSRHAIVIGAGMAGLLVGRVLVDHFDQVTILERDRLPGEAEARKGVPQGNHVHALLVQGYRLLQQWFPDMDAELDALGAQTTDPGQDSARLLGTGESFRTKDDPALTAEFALTMARHYAGDHYLRLPLLSPHYGDLRGLPLLLIHVGEDEILLSDATRLADNARAAEVDVSLAIWPRMWHVWHLLVPALPEARQAVNAIGAFVGERLSKTGEMAKPVRPAR